MKLLVLFLALVAFTAAQPVFKHETKAEQTLAACAKRFNIPEAVLAKQLSSHVVLPIESFEVFLCLFRDLDVWSDSTGYNINNIMIQMLPKNFADKQNLSDSLKNCFDAKREGETPLNWAYRGYRCFDILTKAKSST